MVLLFEEMTTQDPEYARPLERLALATSHPPLYPPGQSPKATYSNRRRPTGVGATPSPG